MCLSYFLMNTGVLLSEAKRGYKDSLEVDKLLILCIFVSIVSSTHEHDCEHFHMLRHEIFGDL